MLDHVKVVLAGEKAVRGINHKVLKSYVARLTREDLNPEEKQEIADKANKLAESIAKTEEKNSEFWYGYGKDEGEIRGMLKAAAIMLVGYIIRGLWQAMLFL